MMRGFTRARHVVAQPQTLDRAVGEVVDDDIGSARQAQMNSARPSVEPFEVDRDAALVAIQEVEVGAVAGRHAARLIALARPLHLDDVGAQVGQQQSRRRPGDDVAELEDAQAVERKRAVHGAR